MSLSVALATYCGDSYDIIRRCIESVYDWCDEIVFVYGSPKDESIKKLNKLDKDHKIKIILTDNPPMFHLNKQKALNGCTKDWILQLDADEVVSPELKKEIIQVINSKSQIPNSKETLNSNIKNLKLNKNFKFKIENSQPVVAYWLPRLNYFLGVPLTKGGQYPDYTLRLYRNGIAHFPCKSVHENVMISQVSQKLVPDKKSGLVKVSKTKKNVFTNSTNSDQLSEAGPVQPNIGYLHADLLHYPWSSLHDYIEKGLVRYSRDEAQNMYKKGERPSLSNWIKYFLILPPYWFLLTYIRHRGYVDGIPGFVFSLFSSLRFPLAYWKLMNKTSNTKHQIPNKH